jgi:tetratricopeptide (TPR) repeat protein
MPTQGFPTSEALLNRIARGKMVGREDELTELKRRWDKVCLGEPVEPVLLIAGEPGIGKTRLIRELQVYSNLRDGYVLQSTAQEQDAGSPYVTIATALRKYVHEQPFEVLRRQTPGFIAGEVVKFAPELAEKIGYVPPNPPLEPTAERDRLLEQISNFLLNLAHERPTLLLFDDLHYADPGSLEILETMARNSSGASLLIAAAYRDVALSHSSPVNHFLRTLQFNRLAHRIPLRRLSRRAVEQMLEALLGDTVSQKFLDSIYETTEGNPLFVEEVVKGLVVDGQIVLFDGHWTQRDSGVVQVPGGIKSVLGSRLERITKPTLEILQIAAVIGRNFSLDTLSQASPYNDEATQQAIAEALQLQLIDPQKSPQQIISAENLLFQFQHSFIRETLYEELRPLRRRRLHRKVAEAIEKLAGQDGVSNPAVLARHFIDGAQDEKAVSYLHRAGDAARQFYANAEAVDHFSQAREILEDIAPDLQGEELRANIAEQFQLLEKESNVFGLMGNRSRQLEALQKSKELAEALNEKERWVEVTAQLATYYWGIGELDQALETARQGMTVAQQHQDRRGELACLEQVVRVLWTRRDSEAMTYATQALVIAQELRDRPREGQLTQLVGHIYADTLHDPRRASIYFNQALEICRTAGNHLEEAWTLWGMGGLALFIDDYVTALARYSQAKGIAESLGATLQVGWDLYHMGDAWYSLGNNEQALDCYQQAQVIFNKARHQRGQIYSQISLGLTYMAMAQLDEVLNYLDKARQAAEARNDSTLIFRSYQALAAYYCLLGGQANLTYAVRLSNRIIQMASGKNYFEHELLGYYLRGSGFLGLGQINEGLSSSKEAITRLENLTYLHSPQISAAEIYYRHSLILTRASQPDVAQIYLQKAYNETTRKANLIANEQQRATFLNIRLNREIMAASRAG